jgi:hypothetical protein
MQELRKYRFLCGCLIILVGFCDCGRPEPNSSIVRRVELAGAGNLQNASKEVMREWLAKHKETAYQVDDMCRPVRDKAIAQWRDTAEGRLCAAARELAFWRPGPVTGDDKKYLPGVK